MIYYDQWLSNDPKLKAVRARENEASAAATYAILKPLRIALGRASALLRQGWQSWQADLRRRAGLRELNRMDDRLLEDIGIARGQIAGLAHNVVRGQRTEYAAKRLIKPQPAQPAVDFKAECQVIPFVRARQLPDGSGENGFERRPLDAA